MPGRCRCCPMWVRLSCILVLKCLFFRPLPPFGTQYGPSRNHQDWRTRISPLKNKYKNYLKWIVHSVWRYNHDIWIQKIKLRSKWLELLNLITLRQFENFCGRLMWAFIFYRVSALQTVTICFQIVFGLQSLLVYMIARHGLLILTQNNYLYVSSLRIHLAYINILERNM